MTAATETAPPAGTAPATDQKADGPGGAKLALLLACASAFVLTIDATGLSIAFPDLRADFPAASLATLTWVVTSYMVFFAAVLPPAGRLTDVLGPRRLFLGSVAAFGVASALCAAAPSEGILIAGRVVQGAAAAGIMPSGLGIVLTRTPPDRVMAAIGIWAAVGSLAAAVGPAVGGVLVDVWGWRAFFMINVPIALAVVWGTGRLSRDSPSESRLPDFLGTVLLVAGVGSIVVGLSQGSEWGWRSGSVIGALVGGAVVVVASLMRSARHPAPALELDLWRNRTFAVTIATSVPFCVAAFSYLVVAPLFLTTVWGYSVLEAGLATTPGAFASTVASLVVGKLATTPTARRAAAVSGSVFAAVGTVFLWGALGTEAHYLTAFLPANLLVGIGVGAALTALYGSGATSVPPTRQASGNALVMMSQNIGGALGVAAMAAIIAAPGHTGVDGPYRAVFLFCSVAAVVAAVVAAGLSRSEVAGAAGVAGAADAAGAAEVRADPERADGRVRPARPGPAVSPVPSPSAAGRRGRVVGAVALATALLGTGVFAVAGNAGTCSGGDTVTVRVEVAPEIEPAVAGAVERFNDARHEAGGACVQAEATTADPAQVAALLGRGAAGATPPDAWIPDSSLWVSLLLPRDESRRVVEPTGTSVAQAPVVAAVSHTAADTSWAELVGGPDSGGQGLIPTGGTRLQVPDPARNATGLATLLLAGQRAGSPGPLSGYTEAAGRLRAATVPDVAAGFATFATFQADQQGPPPALVATEQAVFAYNKANPNAPARVVYPPDGSAGLDYPYVITTADPATVDAARLLEAELRAEATRVDVRALGFRPADVPAPASPGLRPEPAPRPLPAPAPAEVHKAMQAWQLQAWGVRTLAIVDISASMDAADAGMGLTPLALATRAAGQALAPMPDDAEVGVWLSAHTLGGGRGWAEMVSLGRLGDPFGPAPRSQQISFGLRQIRAIPGEDTGLYDAILAAFRTVSRSYDPQRANSVLVFTGGTGDAPGGTSLPDLVAALRAEYDPARPVPVVVVGYGGGVDRAALGQIADATGGSVYLATTPDQAAQVEQVLLTDISRRPTEHGGARVDVPGGDLHVAQVDPAGP
jgi:EmrB/QacA subfamily drug resistance transporter